MPRCIKASVHCTQLCLFVVDKFSSAWICSRFPSCQFRKQGELYFVYWYCCTNKYLYRSMLSIERKAERTCCVLRMTQIQHFCYTPSCLSYNKLKGCLTLTLQYTIFTWLHMTDSKHTNAKWWNLMHCVVCNWACTMLVSVLDQQAIYFTTIVHMEVVLIADTDEL